MSEVYEQDSFVLAYLKWHYRQGLREFFAVVTNFLWFVAHFFSFKLLIKTLLVPWKRLGENYEGGFQLTEFASTFIVNTLMRIVGFITRSFVLIIGAVSYLLVLVFSFFLFLIWVLAPAILLGSLVLAVIFFMI